MPIEYKSPLYIITGEQGEGKTTLLMGILKRLKESGVRISGIAAPGYFRNGLRDGFSLVDLSTGDSIELCSTEPFPNSRLLGRYYFREDGLLFGKEVLENSVNHGRTDLIVIDEVGRFELNGDLWADTIDQILKEQYPPLLWCVRKCLSMRSLKNGLSLKQ